MAWRMRIRGAVQKALHGMIMNPAALYSCGWSPEI
jgi:hypothetical protein